MAALRGGPSAVGAVGGGNCRSQNRGTETDREPRGDTSGRPSVFPPNKLRKLRPGPYLLTTGRGGGKLGTRDGIRCPRWCHENPHTDVVGEPPAGRSRLGGRPAQEAGAQAREGRARPSQ